MVGLVLTVAAALTAAPEVNWDAPATCPGKAELDRLVAAQVADVPADQINPVRADARVEQVSAERWKLVVDLETTTGTDRREVVLESCDAAAEALALIVALAVAPVQPEPTTPEAETAPEVEPATEPELGPEPNAEPAPVQTPPPLTREPAPRPVRRPRVGLRIFAGAGFGFVSPVGGQVGLELALVWKRLRVAARVDHAIRRQVRLDAPQGAGGNISTTSAGVSAGPVFSAGRVEFPIVALFEAGGMRARGIGATRNDIRTVPWVVAGAGAGVWWFPRSWVGLGVSADLLAALLRHTFTLGGFRVRTTGVVGGRALAGIDFRFP